MNGEHGKEGWETGSLWVEKRLLLTLKNSPIGWRAMKRSDPKRLVDTTSATLVS